MAAAQLKPDTRGLLTSPGDASASSSNSNAARSSSFVICEVCDGYIKDLELLRHHMNLVHKVSGLICVLVCDLVDLVDLI